MFTEIFSKEQIIFCVLAAELFFLILLQLRANGLLKRTLRARAQKKETVRQMKEEVKNGKSDIPVVKFEKPKEQKAPETKKEKMTGYDPKEMAVLQEMMTEFFG